MPVNVYIWFFAVTALSTIGGVLSFRVLFTRPDFTWSDRVGTGFAGSFLGAFAGFITLAAYDIGNSFLGQFGVPTVIGVAFSVGMQKIFADMALANLLTGDSDESKH